MRGPLPELIGTGNSKTTATETLRVRLPAVAVLRGSAAVPHGRPSGQTRRPSIASGARDSGIRSRHSAAAGGGGARIDADRIQPDDPRSFNEVALRFGEANQLGEHRLIRFSSPIRHGRTAYQTGERTRVAPSDGGRLCGLCSSLQEPAWFFATRHLESLAVVPLGDVDSASQGPRNRRSQSIGPRAILLLEMSQRPARRFRPLPRPNADGVVVVDTGLYEARSLSFVGDLSIRGPKSAPAVIVGRRPTARGDLPSIKFDR